MLKPRLIKSLITHNAALLREKQQLMEYLRVVEMTLRILTKSGKDSGIVDLKELHALCMDMRKVISANDVRNYEKMGTLRAPSKKDLGKLAEADQNIMHGFFQGSPEEMHNFFDKLITDLMSGKFGLKDGEAKSDNIQFPIDPNNFGGDLEGEWQDSFPPPDDQIDPFGDLGLDKPK